MGCEIFHALKKVLKDQGLSTAVGDEGGFAPNLASNVAALESLSVAVEKAGYKLGDEIVFALDVASSEFFDAEKGKYVFGKSDGSERDSDEMVAFYEELVNKFPIRSIEDGCDENDWDGWKKLTDAIGDKVQLVGDDLFVTNVDFLKKGIDQGGSQLDPRQGEPDRFPDRDFRCRGNGQGSDLHLSDLSSFRRNRGRHHCRYCRSHQRGSD